MDQVGRRLTSASGPAGTDIEARTVPGDGAGLVLPGFGAIPDLDPAIGRALDAIYAGAMAARPTKPGFDRDLRRPHRLLGLIAAAGLMPDPDRVILVTGSKGKGSTARLIAAGETAAGRRTLLFTSPEETTALDRIRLDGAVIRGEDFLRHHAALAPQVEALAARLPSGEALSPFGQFLAIALAHARETGAGRLVIETGRGAAHDEAGRLRARIGVVTAILPEHLDRLGPTLADVAAEKLDIRRRCGCTILTAAAAMAGQAAGIHPANALVVPALPPDAADDRPGWLRQDLALAHAALAADGIDPTTPGIAAALDRMAASVPSWGRMMTGDGREIGWEAAVQAASLDAGRLARLADTGWRVLLSVTDDKDVDGLVDTLAGAGLPTQAVVLQGRRGPLVHGAAVHRRLAARLGQGLEAPLRGPIDHDDVPAMARLLYDTGGANATPVLAVGTQTFLRLVRAAIRTLPDARSSSP